jgi:hypothetical protein
MHRQRTITLERLILALLGAAWLTLVLSDYGILTGSRGTYYPGKFTTTGQPFESVTCYYWTGLGRHYEYKTGAPGRVRCDRAVRCGWSMNWHAIGKRCEAATLTTPQIR